MSAKPLTRGNLLIDEPPLMVLPRLAKAIGLNEAIVLQQLHFLLNNPKNGATVGGARYIYNTYQEWQEHFEFLSEPTIKRTFLNLERQGLVTSIQANKRKHDHRKYYRVEYDALDRLDRGSLSTVARGKSKSKRSVRSDQIDPIRTDQTDPFLYRQRRQQKELQRNPPTPEPSFGGYTDSPGEKTDSSPRDDCPNNGTAPGAGRTSKQDWVAKAMSHPGARAFLALVNLTEFPASGRQPLARAFASACDFGAITCHQLQLLTAVKDVVKVPTSPARLISTFADVVVDARDAANERLIEIDHQLVPSVSDPLSLLQTMAAADKQIASFTPEELFAPELVLPFPTWLLLALYIKRGVAVEVWAHKLAAQVIDELVMDVGVVPFLQQVGIDLQGFGVDAAQIETARSVRHATLTKERTILKDLLRGHSVSALKSTTECKLAA